MAIKNKFSSLDYDEDTWDSTVSLGYFTLYSGTFPAECFSLHKENFFYVHIEKISVQLLTMKMLIME
jgi:hypothetical protein